ncbi:hypothetical protein BC834DRAFT_345282 [Gloeopeniophorella convolvens]|nr:hypothetical protein BC834DRAFT_345282 [Gloeopeniophorella convolvens]
MLKRTRELTRTSSEHHQPPTPSPTPSYSSPRRLHPAPARPRTGSPLAPAADPAEVVAAAINQSSQLERASPENTPTSTPLRRYQKRPPKPTELPTRNGGRASITPSEASSRAPDVSPARRFSSPPIAVLAPEASSPEGVKMELPESGEGFDELEPELELELSYPPSPSPPPQDVPPDIPVAPPPLETQPPAELEPEPEPPTVTQAPELPAEPEPNKWKLSGQS